MPLRVQPAREQGVVLVSQSFQLAVHQAFFLPRANERQNVFNGKNNADADAMMTSLRRGVNGGGAVHFFNRCIRNQK